MVGPARINTDKPHQRKGSKSNAHAGAAFELQIARYYAKQEIQVERDYVVPIGVGGTKKSHRFDLGSAESGYLVECKSHTWTEGNKVPSAKMAVWNQAMYYFHIAPKRYRKVLFVLKATSSSRRETLAEHYVRTYSHLIPPGVEIWEFNDRTREARRVH